MVKSASKRVESGRRTAQTRNLTVKVCTAKGRPISSTKWLERQLNDPYVSAAKRDGYRSRAAYKLLDINDRYHLIKRGHTVIDLGAAPGGWAQVMASLTGASEQKGVGQVFALDILKMDPISGVTLVHHDFMACGALETLNSMISGYVDGVFSDMAAPTTGNRAADHIRTMRLCEAALGCAAKVLKPGGVFVCKVFQGGTEKSLLDHMKQAFHTVKHAKPPSSRKDSREAYVVCSGFRRPPDFKLDQDHFIELEWSPI